MPDGSLIVAVGASNNGGGAMSSLTADDAPACYSPELNSELGGAVTIAEYSDEGSGLTFSQWHRNAEVPTECSWCAVTIGIR